MYYGAIDLASKESYVYIRDRRGLKVQAQSIETNRKNIRDAFDGYLDKGIEVAIEAGGSTRWVHDELKKMGAGVYVVNPNRVKLIAETKKKTDKVDAKVLSDLLRMNGLPERVYMAEGKTRELRDLMQGRYQIIKGYTNLMNHVRGMLRQEGIRLKPKELDGRTSYLGLVKKSSPSHLKEVVSSYERIIEVMQEEKKGLEDDICSYKSPEIELAKTVPGIGEIASRTVMSAIGEIRRFKKAKKLTSYCGLVPSVHQSGERIEYGPITREGRSEVRRVGIQCAHAVLRSKSVESAPLRRWHARIAKRRGMKTALVALARKLITILFYVLRDQRPYDYQLLRVA